MNEKLDNLINILDYMSGEIASMNDPDCKVAICYMENSLNRIADSLETIADFITKK